MKNIQNDDDLEGVTRLYILLGLVEFFFPMSWKYVYGGWVKLLDDIESLSKYNWGFAVYEVLVTS